MYGWSLRAGVRATRREWIAAEPTGSRQTPKALTQQAAEWREILRSGYPAQAPQVLRDVIGPIELHDESTVPDYIKDPKPVSAEEQARIRAQIDQMMTPVKRGGLHYRAGARPTVRWRAKIRLLDDLVPCMASPRGYARVGAPETFIEGDIAA